jgi:hypothetical protein
MKQRIEDDGKALTHLDLFADLGGELEGRFKVLADDWNESKTLGEDLKHLSRLTEGRHRSRSSASSTERRERGGQDQAEKGTRSERGRAGAGLGWRLLPFRVSPVREWRRSIRIPFSSILRSRGPHAYASLKLSDAVCTRLRR